MIPILLVAAGGALGAVARFLVSTAVTQRLGGQWPWGTLIINLSGCFLISLFLGAGTGRIAESNLRYLLPIGFVGAYTTFSTWMLETWRLAEDGAVVLALANAGGSIAAGLVAVVAGLTVGRLLA